MLIGLAAKNAILIVEFAKAKHEEGMSLEDAALTSARLRFRPILMTAFAFILGVVPLMKASGAGAGAQNVMGIGVFFGMLVATAFGVFIIPGNYTFIEGLGRRKGKQKAAAPPQVPVTADAGGEHRLKRLFVVFLLTSLHQSLRLRSDESKTTGADSDGLSRRHCDAARSAIHRGREMVRALQG